MKRASLKGSVDEQKTLEHQTMLEGRLRKNLRKFKAKFERSETDAFRVYDWDIPEIRAVVDYYAGHLVVGEYVRKQTGSDWLPKMGQAAARALSIPEENLHLKRRKTQPQTGARYEPTPVSSQDAVVVARENGLRFSLRMEAHLDVGLFCDQRRQRAELARRASGSAVLNLFSYTGGFAVAALSGGAKHVTSVDQSKTYLDWSQDNLRLNQLPLERHEPARQEVHSFLKQARTHGRTWDFIIVDPPSYSTVGASDRGFDVIRDHDELLRACRAVASRRGELWFSTNHQAFEPGEALRGFRETTDSTLPEDFRRSRPAHRSWRWAATPR